MALPELSLPPWAYNVEPAGAPLLRGAQAGALIRQGRENRAQHSLAQRHLALQEQQMQAARSGVALQQDLMKEELREKKWAMQELLDGEKEWNDWREKYPTAQSAQFAPLPVNQVAATKAQRFQNAISETTEGRFRSNSINMFRKAKQELAPYDPAGVAKLDEMPFDPNTGLPTSEHWAGIKSIIDTVKAKNIKQYGEPTGTTVDLGGERLTFNVPEALVKEREVGRLLDEAKKASEAGDTELAKRLTESAKALRPKQSTMRVYDDKGNVIFETGGADELQIGTKGRLELQSHFYDAAISALSETINTIRPQDVGIPGAFGDVVVNRVLGGAMATLYPERAEEFADTKLVSGRTQLELLKNVLERTISPQGDTRFSNEDRKVLGPMIDGLDITKHWGILKPQFIKVRKEMAKRLRSNLELLGRPLHPAVLTPQEMEDAFKKAAENKQKAVEKGLLTKEQRASELAELRAKMQEDYQKWGIQFNAP